MLDLMQHLAARFAPARAVLIGLAALGALAAGISLVAFEAAKGDLVLFPALVVLLWAVLGVVFIDLFARIPKAPEAGEAGADGCGGCCEGSTGSLPWAF
ncbi:MAG: hypothetical protein KFB96_16970 [Thiocapsa sp.]|uniref:hypothetical protein n=1 Tax=Thiocapsa sp. TaxID=2024551 RepID=UPI001BCD8AFD|nr:hypothetical protein [Thiocapsa sp.]QVL47391.1 MAG: hypothetical protein KFB96_16970 [Thiocapsa sp.]